jgi:hypothetical protein
MQFSERHIVRNADGTVCCSGTYLCPSCSQKASAATVVSDEQWLDYLEHDFRPRAAAELRTNRRTSTRTGAMPRAATTIQPERKTAAEWRANWAKKLGLDLAELDFLFEHREYDPRGMSVNGYALALAKGAVTAASTHPVHAPTERMELTDDPDYDAYGAMNSYKVALANQKREAHR